MSVSRSHWSSSQLSRLLCHQTIVRDRLNAMLSDFAAARRISVVSADWSANGPEHVAACRQNKLHGLEISLMDNTQSSLAHMREEVDYHAILELLHWWSYRKEALTMGSDSWRRRVTLISPSCLGAFCLFSVCVGRVFVLFVCLLHYSIQVFLHLDSFSFTV